MATWVATLRSVLVGERVPRRRVAATVLVLLVGLTAAFLVRPTEELFSPVGLFLAALSVSLWAGWTRAGFFAGGGAVFWTVVWRYVVPPAVGYVRGSTAPRYAPPRLQGYEQPPRAELMEGLHDGPLLGLILALSLAPLLYGVGAVGRRAVERVLPG